ncbi:MAG TPA: leucyl aminopeptidase [Gammaproteobacteria bacterium]
MQFSVKTGDLADIQADCVVVGIFQERESTPSAKALDKAAGGALREAMQEDGFKGRGGEAQLVLRAPGIKAKRVLLVGLGKREEFRPWKLENLLRNAAAKLRRSDAKSAVFALHEGFDDTARGARDVVSALSAALYRFDACKSKNSDDKQKLAKIILTADDKNVAAIRKAVKEGEALAAGVTLARDLGNLPGNICTPTYLANEAKKMGRTYENLKVSVLDEKKMEELGMGALLSVSRGSREPAKLIIFEYKGGSAKQKPHAIVGKGLTFDAGGISIKPAPAMDEMKFDMCGGASVFGTIKALCELGAKINVIGIVPSSENLPDGAANKPGDIVTSMSGQTIEILNTDAEGRLILCDALTYAERYKPETVIDIATLTGACVIALGSHATGLLGNDDAVIDNIKHAADASGDRVWQLPLWDDYQEQLKSPFADMANIGGREAGTITAGCFLARYTKKFRWAHLDVAGTAWNSGSHKGSTGRPVPLLFRYLLDNA